MTPDESNCVRCACCGRLVNPDEVFVTPAAVRVIYDEIPAGAPLCEDCGAEITEWSEEAME